MKIIGKFIGKTSSGFVTGRVYELQIGTDTQNHFIWVTDLHSSAACPYANIQALGNNWEIPTNEPFRN